jgi:hypothetical protein
LEAGKSGTWIPEIGEPHHVPTDGLRPALSWHAAFPSRNAVHAQGIYITTPFSILGNLGNPDDLGKLNERK